MSTVTGFTFGEVAGTRRSRGCAQRVIKECIDVARAAGVTMAPVQGTDIVRLFDYDSSLKRILSNALIPVAMRKHRRLKSSMLQDIERGKATEIDCINGLVGDVGRKHGVPTPYCDLVVRMVHRIESGELVPGPDNLALFPAY
jgi:2-dehydropantoate 2-reductase